MDKKQGGLMIRKRAALFILLIFIIMLSGCETMKGAAGGAKKDFQALKKADQWMRDNLW
jgi:predicted small secreted protein